DAPRFSVPRLKHVLRAKAVLCPGLRMRFNAPKAEDSAEWYYEDGLKDYLKVASTGYEVLPAEPLTGSMAGSTEGVDWAVHWLPDGGELLQERYVNLIPRARCGTPVYAFA